MGRKITLDQMVWPLEQQMRDRELSQAQLAIRVGRDRSRISRALSGREMPARELLIDIARVLDLDVEQTLQQWQEVDAARRQARLSRAGGGPPDGLWTYDAFLCALRNLLRERRISHRELAQRDLSGLLKRSTVGAVLRGERSARWKVVAAIVQVCQVSEVAARAWHAAWVEVGKPHQRELHERRREGLARRRRAEALRALAKARRTRGVEGAQIMIEFPEIPEEASSESIRKDIRSSLKTAMSQDRKAG
ncbi:helix-turn-helix transcriptional regulator [Bailinhaonella thermotolerans]|uniref:XRE family transcriptional regulator n=1 Tax=Bailinhaonella thermotolerans TaxID=1070861 RepID=A0A3A4AHT7_9ACTN|nr:helix-turn-helix transcriptional regulator [Bailinhaonella thermotolerans]RJL20174.1 XRE family transcriptional regulator [Bailinhaonella thermotolerans]